ncbi:MAG: ABC transporter ATP-binding protein [Gammaproteobacteria bacterium]|nr:ABC transporter ATP-binding protein [Gammaproteobacteria bacterium]MDH5730096.1 ABC transporter ATP-binding protein [Gammaproteobacteria bacterium]
MIKLQNISRSYTLNQQIVHALKNVSLEISAGDFVAITGKSGSGKSSLLSVIGCMDSDFVGDYYYDQQRINQRNEDELAQLRNQHFGFIFQHFFLINRLTAVQNVELPLYYQGVEHDQRKLRAQQLLRVLGLGDRLTHKPSQLSGGQQQRVAIARALVTNPDIILADEPTANLDHHAAQQLFGLLLQLNQRGKTIIFVTHDLALTRYARRVIQLDNGRIEKDEAYA